jgi:cellulose synthase/poly-beta-1,6-N-acetylglucosamine synthase-like glycosyltransferase
MALAWGAIKREGPALGCAHAFANTPMVMAAEASEHLMAGSVVRRHAARPRSRAAAKELLFQCTGVHGDWGLCLRTVLGFALWILLDAWLGLLPILVTLGRNRANSSAQLPTCTVVIPAYNEAGTLRRTLDAVCAQNVAGLMVRVMDDGSIDGTAEIASRYADSDPRVALQQLERGGKAHALNAALAQVTTDVLVTVDADTLLTPGALADLLHEFEAEAVEAASGFVVATRAESLLGCFQRLEYVRASAVRAGYSRLGMHEQAPGAFTAFRTQSLRNVGGFPDSLTEDYEVVFRLYDQARKDGRKILVRSSQTAIASTSTARTLSALHAQRTRWFAGFLVTLWRYRSMQFDSRLGAFGLVRLPLKLLDALLPVLAVFGWFFAAKARGNVRIELPLLTLGLMTNLLATLIANRGVNRLRAVEWLLLPLEPAYAFVRKLLVLRAYAVAVRATRGLRVSWLPLR